MADAKKCDRCGRLYEPYHRRNDKLMPYVYSGHTVNCIRFYDEMDNNEIRGARVDLCLDCMSELLRWLYTGDVSNLDTKTEVDDGQGN